MRLLVWIRNRVIYINWFKGFTAAFSNWPLLRNKKLVELHPQMVIDFLCVCNRHSSATLILHAQEVLAVLLRVPDSETGIDITWRIVAFAMASCTLGDLLRRSYFFVCVV